MLQQEPDLAMESNGDGNLPLHLLCMNPKATVEAVQYVAKEYPEAIREENNAGKKPVDLVVDAEMSRLLGILQGPRNDSNPATRVDYPLHHACSNKDVTVHAVQAILQKSPDEVCMLDSEEMLPIHVACRAGACMDLIQCLVAH